MESLHAASRSNRADRSVVQLTDRQSEQHARERSSRDYGAASSADRVPKLGQACNAPVSLELSGAAHPVEAFANFVETDNGASVKVRLVDAITTLTVGELTVNDPSAQRLPFADYSRMRLQARAVDGLR